MPSVKEMTEAKQLLITIQECKTSILGHCTELLKDEEIFPKDLALVTTMVTSIENSLSHEDPESSLRRLLDKFGTSNSY